MKPIAPGAGSRPPELAGREAILKDAQIAVQRALIGKPSRSQLLLGLRGAPCFEQRPAPNGYMNTRDSTPPFDKVFNIRLAGGKP